MSEDSIKTNNIKIITLIGSASQKEMFDYYNEVFTLAGYAVFSCGCWRPDLHDADERTNEVKRILQAVHRRKIDASDIVAYIPKKDGSLGNHSKDEYVYAMNHGKFIIHAGCFYEGLKQSGEIVFTRALDKGEKK